MTTTQTTNYGFVKPVAGSGELVSVQAHLDDNWDKVDQDMGRFDRQVFTSTGTWNKPARAKRVKVVVVGGGGGSGGIAATAAGQISLSAGAGAGGVSEKLFLASALAASETVTVGAAGTAGASGNNNGGNGGDSSFATGKAYVVTGNGGALSLGGAAGAGSGSIAGGAGGVASGGDLNMPGGDGGQANFLSTLVQITAYGGSNPYSSPVSTSSAGQAIAGKQYGGGASGNVNNPSTAAKAGAAGAAGVVMVDVYY